MLRTYILETHVFHILFCSVLKTVKQNDGFFTLKYENLS